MMLRLAIKKHPLGGVEWNWEVSRSSPPFPYRRRLARQAEHATELVDGRREVLSDGRVVVAQDSIDGVLVVRIVERLREHRSRAVIEERLVAADLAGFLTVVGFPIKVREREREFRRLARLADGAVRHDSGGTHEHLFRIRLHSSPHRAMVFRTSWGTCPQPVDTRTHYLMRQAL